MTLRTFWTAFFLVALFASGGIAIVFSADEYVKWAAAVVMFISSLAFTLMAEKMGWGK